MPPLWETPQNVGMKLAPEKLGSSYGKNFTILTSTVFVGFTCVTDGQTDGWAIAYTVRAIAYMLSCVKTKPKKFLN